MQQLLARAAIAAIYWALVAIIFQGVFGAYQLVSRKVAERKALKELDRRAAALDSVVACANAQPA